MSETFRRPRHAYTIAHELTNMCCVHAAERFRRAAAAAAVSRDESRGILNNITFVSAAIRENFGSIHAALSLNVRGRTKRKIDRNGKVEQNEREEFFRRLPIENGRLCTIETMRR